MEQIFNILRNEVPDVNKHLNYINAGGCLLFAQALQRELAKHGVKSKIVVVDLYRGGLEDMITGAKAKGVNEAYQKFTKDHALMYSYCRFPHAVNMIGNKFFDSSGEVFHGNNHSNALTPKTVEALVGCHEIWNHMFKDYNNDNNDIIGTMERDLINAFKGFNDGIR